MTAYKLWGGRFRKNTSERLSALNDSFSFDRVLLDDEIEASKAWAVALQDAGVLSAIEAKKIVDALEVIGEMDEGNHTHSYEDVHSYVEALLAEKVGDLAGKLHTGRSRNDQVATDFKLYLKRELNRAIEGTLELSQALVYRAAQENATAMPGYTHLQPAEPVTFGHWCLAYVQMLMRDVDRFSAALARADECPLGSGALAGTPLPIDRNALAQNLGFARATANSLDAVSDRDAALDYAYAVSMLLGHLSRFSEDLIIYTTEEFGFLRIPDELATGSSRMPQKKNPDLLELVRGHAARAIGELTGLMALTKGLPLAYNKDLQLDKEPVFRLAQTTTLILRALVELVEGLEIDRERMEQRASSDSLVATARADALAKSGVPFRAAHEAVSSRFGTPGETPPPSLTAILARHSAIGGTAPDTVAAAAADALERIKKKKETLT